ncbi:MAG: RagB/SusD family nutrient uptake outer membrane protein [Prevotellaceae bacterium]|jgi:hypothetical protein|nr:RagB/SusD family nutrient uptake outer membrane protein [Prevotellaceae bacterium]
MKKYTYILIIVVFVGSILASSCGDDFLTSSSSQKRASGEAVTETILTSFLTSAYQPLLFDSYAANNYNSIVLMSDLRSDDMYKGGGSADDQLSLYQLSLYTTSPTTSLIGLWTIYYSGLARCNNVLMNADEAVGVDPAKVEQYKAEAYFLRAYYTHLLWKLFGNIPYFTEHLAEPFVAPQYSADEVYAFIMADLTQACAEGKMAMRTSGADLGRASRAAALMLKARVVMYQKDQSRYDEITNDMATIIQSGQYDLFPDFAAMWDDENEFCIESIFESNQLPEGKTWSSAWQGYGTNLPAFISPDGLQDPNGVFKGGWGFGPVRPAAYAAYSEPGDTRREGSINAWPDNSYTPRFQNTGLFARKYAARVNYNPPPGDQDLNYTNNLRIFRYAETLLNYVELVKMHGQGEKQGVSADQMLLKLRSRAFAGATAPALTATADNIKLERRREFLGEGMRFWDLIRWGDAERLLTENDQANNSTRTFADWKKYLPIPQSEIDKAKGTAYELKQNPNWQ